MLRACVRAFASAAGPSRPFRVLGLQQIAIGGADKTQLSKLWGGMFGLQQTGTYKSEKENVDEDIFQLGKGATAVEVRLRL